MEVKGYYELSNLVIDRKYFGAKPGDEKE